MFNDKYDKEYLLEWEKTKAKMGKGKKNREKNIQEYENFKSKMEKIW